MQHCGWLLKCDYIVGNSEQSYCGYGNYKNETVKVNNNLTTIEIRNADTSGTNQKLRTAQCSYTKSNNIYDLAGNCYERVQEAVNSNVRIYRGAQCTNAHRNIV